MTTKPKSTSPSASPTIRVMKPTLSFSLVVLPCVVAAYSVDPPSTAAANTIDDCTYWHIAADAERCSDLAEYWGLAETQLATYNPSLADSCDLITGNSYCVEQNWGMPVPTPISSSAVSTSVGPTSTPAPSTDLDICEAEAGGYKRYCQRCLSRCATFAAKDQCFQGTFFAINGYDSDCWKHGGNDCANKAVDHVCPQE